MANQSKVAKQRWCKHCKGAVYGTATDVATHAKFCQIALRSGLVLPGGIVTPEQAFEDLRRSQAEKAKRPQPSMGGGRRLVNG